MADDKSKTKPQDASRINIHEDYQVRYWMHKFGCTAEQLKTAVSQIGTSARTVEEALKR